MRPVDEILDNWEEHFERGINLSPEELCVDHPELLDEVRWQIEALQAVDSDFGMSPGATPTMQSLADATYVPPDEISLTSRYRLRGFHASGGLGQVYVAMDEVLNRKVAIKFPKRQGMSAEQIARFEQEAMITGQLDHPGIVPIHALHSGQGSEPCYVMRFVDGSTLQQAVEQLSQEEIGFNADYYQSNRLRHWLQALVTVCNISAYAHQQNIVHRDIKPSNILLGPFGETILLDWGIAKKNGWPTSDDSVQPTERPPARKANLLSSPIQTLPGRTLGTPAYASPEQLLGNLAAVGPPSDIFSLGATLFFILVGKTPLELAGWSTHMELVVQPQSDLSRLLPRSVPTGLRAICRKALEIEPQQRYTSATQLASDLDRYLAREPISVVPESWRTRLGRAARKRPKLTGGLIAAAIVLTIAAIASSTIVNRKNQQLFQSNQDLNSALTNVEQANQLAMQALRGMVDESITKRFAEREALTESDKSYLESILSQYMVFASLQRTSERTQAIQAEAHRQIGALYFQLDRNDQAYNYLKTAIEIYEELLRSHNLDSYRLEVAGILEIMGMIEAGRNQAEQSVQTTTKGIETLQPLMLTVEDVPDNEFESIVANLHLVRAEACQKLGRPQDALSDYKSALAILDRRIVFNPENLSLRQSIGTTLRAYASLLNELADDRKSKKLAMSLADRSIEILNKAAEQHPETRGYQLSLAWAYYDRSFIFQGLEDLQKAISDMYIATDIVTKLRDRYPLIEIYRDALAPMLVRRIKLHLANDNLLHAIGDARNLSELKLSLEEISFAIQVMQRGIVDDGTETIDTDSLEHVADMLARRAKMQLDLSLPMEAREDYKLASLYSERLVRLNPNHIFRREMLIALLIDLAAVQHSLGEQQHAEKSLRQTEEWLLDLKASNPSLAEPLQLQLNKAKEVISSKQ